MSPVDIEDAAKSVRRRIDQRKINRSLEDMQDDAEAMIAVAVGSGAIHTFEEAIERNGLSVICEVVSPDAGGELCDEDCVDLGYEFDAGDADAVTFIADADASRELFRDFRDEVSVPIARRDLMVDLYQVYEAKSLGADAVTLYAGVLSSEELTEFLATCEKLRMAAIVEAHSPEELKKAVDSYARIICTCFEGDNDDICDMVPENRTLIQAYGVNSVEDAIDAGEAGFDAVIAGPFVMEAYKDGTLRDVIRSIRE